MLGCIQPISSPMMKRMLGFCCCCCCCCCAAAGVLVGPDSEIDINVAALISAAQDLVCKPLMVLRKVSRMLGGLLLSKQSDIASPSCMRCLKGSSPDASKAEMARGRVDRLRMTRSRPIAAA